MPQLSHSVGHVIVALSGTYATIVALSGTYATIVILSGTDDVTLSGTCFLSHSVRQQTVLSYSVRQLSAVARRGADVTCGAEYDNHLICPTQRDS
jgi:hypothetical protein